MIETINTETRTKRADSSQRGTVVLVCLGILAITWLVFGQTLRHEFVNFDDNEYIADNPIVKKGVTAEGIGWAFTSAVIGHWHPLTWISHMLDCQVFRQWAGGHHLTNVLLHSTAAVLLFLLLQRMTGFLWRSAFVAVLFAIHPLKVESVAWVSERKDVLSALFFMLTLGAYLHYVRRPFSMVRYGMVITWFGLGLLSKNMLVTMPFLLLLLDYWPLKRFTIHDLRFTMWRLVKEKIPMLVLAIGSCVATFLSPEVIAAQDRLPLLIRLENAAVSYLVYLGQMFWPTRLACYYPNPTDHLPLWQVAGSIGIMLAITALVITLIRTRPYLAMGWFWYLGMLIPVIGLVQISLYAHADRYTYLPQIGLYVALTSAAAELCARWQWSRQILGSAAAIVLVALLVCSRTQASYWRDSESLCSHTLTCTRKNFVAHLDLGNALLQKGRVDDAIAQYRKALDIRSGEMGVHFNLGIALLEKGMVDDAIHHFQTVLQTNPNDPDAQINLGNALLQKGNVDEAIDHFKVALQVQPDSAVACRSLAYACARQQQYDETIHYLKRTVALAPEDAEAQNNLAWLLATASDASLRNGTQAIELAERANHLTGRQNPIVLHTLAAAYAEAGRFPDAVQSARKAITLAQAAKLPDLIQQLNDNLHLYETGQAFHEPNK